MQGGLALVWMRVNHQNDQFFTLFLKLSNNFKRHSRHSSSIKQI